MKLTSFPRSILLSAIAFFSAALLSAAEKSPAPAKPADNYPLKTCVVSDETLTAGEFVSYTHKEAGKPDREIRFCCEGCIDDFKKEPAKFVAKLDAAAKTKAGEKKPDGKAAPGKAR